jgi:hypothetical protein
MAATLHTHPNPAAALALLSGSISEVGSPFRGHGWRRDRVGKKLLPIARVLLARGIWPTQAWLDCLRPDEDASAVPSIEERTERCYDRLERVLGEALLERALDPAERIELRSRAVRALGLLAPADDSNLVRSLGKLYEHPELRSCAKSAQREARDRRRASHLDGELRVMDAWEHFSRGRAQVDAAAHGSAVRPGELDRSPPAAGFE